MSMKPGRNNHAVSVNRLTGGRVRQVANGRNAAVSDADIARIPGGARAIDDMPVANQNIKGCAVRMPDSTTRRYKTAFRYCL